MPYLHLNTFALLLISSQLRLGLGHLRNCVSSFSPPRRIPKRSVRQSYAIPSKTKSTACIRMSSNRVQDETVGQMLGGLVFLKTQMRIDLVEFYTQKLGMKLWLEQPNISILAHGNMILGFHQPEGSGFTPDIQGMYTFVYPSRREVDNMHEILKELADGPPRDNDRYRIYQFFAKDPEGRALEFQAFLHPLDVVSSAVKSP